MIEGLIENFFNHPTDLNHDGVISGSDIPYPAGSIKAKQAWLTIEKLCRSPELVAKAQKINPDAYGMYEGKVLVKGQAGPGQADFDLLRDKLIWYSGYDPIVATKIAGKIKAGLFR